MKLITAVVEPPRASAVRDALALFDVRGLTQSHVFVPSQRGDRIEIFRGARWVVSMEPRTRLDILASEADVADLVRIIVRVAAGDGWVWVTRVDYLVRIRTGEYGVAAL
jgi:nitrogen regulatory protein P-II 1